MLVILMLPAFLPFASHDTLHAIHDSHAFHQQDSHNRDGHGHQRDHHENDHLNETVTNAHHPIAIDIVSYYSDFLHVDLRQTDSAPLVPVVDLDQDIDYDMTADIAAQSRYELASLRLRAPPDKHVYNQDYSPLYLTTLRLRI